MGIYPKNSFRFLVKAFMKLENKNLRKLTWTNELFIVNPIKTGDNFLI